MAANFARGGGSGVIHSELLSETHITLCLVIRTCNRYLITRYVSAGARHTEETANDGIFSVSFHADAQFRATCCVRLFYSHASFLYNFDVEINTRTISYRSRSRRSLLSHVVMILFLDLSDDPFTLPPR